MTIHIKSTVRNAMLSAINAAANAGAAPAYIELRSGTQPVNADTAPSGGAVLATFTCSDPAFETPASGVMDLDAAPDLTDTADATGTAAWARMYDSDANVIFDGSVGTSSADFIITSTSVVTGQTVTLTVGALTQPA